MSESMLAGLSEVETLVANEPLNRAAEARYLQQYLPLVKVITKQFTFQTNSIIARQDLEQVALIGLLEAIRRYGQPDEQFSYYARYRIRGAILDELRKHDWRPRRLRQKSHQLSDDIKKLSKELGREPTFSEVQEHITISTQDYHDYLQLQSAKSFEQLDHLLEQGSVIEALQSKTLEEQIIVQNSLAQAITALDEREQLILHLYYQQELSLKEIALVLELTEARICQMNKKIVEKIKSYFSH